MRGHVYEMLPDGFEGRVEIVVDGRPRVVEWGAPHHLGSCAYWTARARRHITALDLRVGRTLTDEVVFCLLSGYGVSEAAARVAFDHLRDAGLLHASACEADIVAALRQPRQHRSWSRPRRYRFPAQRGARIAACLKLMSDQTPPEDLRELRAWLQQLPGVGPKTASFIVRNQTSAPNVAVIDIHITRAGISAGFFDPAWRLPADYERYEEAFCAIAQLGGTSAATLDAVIWDELQWLGRDAHLLIGRF